MNSEVFNKHLKHMQEVTVDTLASKAAEYATDGDRLHNFKVAAELQGILPRQALAGMMAKHTVSVYDMAMAAEEHSLPLWEEKIKDSINYLFLLWALIHEGLIDTEMATASHEDVLSDYCSAFQANPKEGAL